MTADVPDRLDEAGGRLPDVLAPLVRHWAERLTERHGEQTWQTLEDGAFDDLARLVATSDYAAGVLQRDWSWFCTAQREWRFDAGPADLSALRRYVADIGDSADDVAAVKAAIRRLRNRHAVQVLWRALAGRDDVEASCRSLSQIADALIEASMRYAARQLDERFGRPRDAHGEEIALIALAMGKLGGNELNFSSDIDLIFLYASEGETDGPRTLSAHEYFVRLVRQVVNLLEEVTEDGFAFRVDTRLRPFGDSGPPVSGFAALEAYLLQHGRSWERYAYVKARVISAGATERVVDELVSDLIEPFVYRRYLDYGVFESLREMKALIESEVARKELRSNIKLGPGGIREIEFIAQSLQLVRGGADRTLRVASLRDALQRLAKRREMRRATVDSLLDAYDFLRRVENALQAIRDQQVHDIPQDPTDRARLLVALHYDDWSAFEKELERHRDAVSAHFARIAFRNESGDSAAGSDDTAPPLLRKHGGDVGVWARWLAEREVAANDGLAGCFGAFADDALRRGIDKTAEKRLDRFLHAFGEQLASQRDPLPVCERVLAIVAGVVKRSAYIALLNENPAVLDRLVGLCAQSAYLAEEIARFPLLLDELLDQRLYTAVISAADMRDDLGLRMSRVDASDGERQIETLAQFQRANLFRIAVADIAGSLPIMKVSDRLTELAELVLQTALDAAWRDLVDRHGEPRCRIGGVLRRAGIGVIAYGKLGGMELSYGSDLDLVFIHDSSGEAQETSGPKMLDNSMFFSRLVRRLVHFLTTQTGSGMLYEVDTRLRPSGRSGLLVVGLDGFERYQEDNAWTWEHQALLRARPVAGSALVAREFERIRAETLRERLHLDKLRDEVTGMRSKMRDNLDRSTGDEFDLKQGEGGIGDIEFLVQYLVLKAARDHPAVIHYTDNIRQLGTLDATGVLPAADAAGLQDAYKTYRLCSHRLALDGRPARVSADRFTEERRFVRRLWQREME